MQSAIEKMARELAKVMLGYRMAEHGVDGYMEDLFNNNKAITCTAAEIRHLAAYVVSTSSQNANAALAPAECPPDCERASDFCGDKCKE